LNQIEKLNINNNYKILIMAREGKLGDNEKVLYKTRPNFILSNLSVVFDIILIIIILALTPMIMGNVTKWGMVNVENGVFYILLIIIILLVIFALWRVLVWSCNKYTITDSRIMTTKGVISKDKTSMPYKTIQDLKVKQGVLDRLFGVGTVYLYSAYDGTDLELSKISKPDEVEEILFNQLDHYRSNNQQ